MPPFIFRTPPTPLEKILALTVGAVFLAMLVWMMVSLVLQRRREKRQWYLEHGLLEIEQKMRKNESLSKADFELLDRLIKPYLKHPLIRGLSLGDLSADMKLRLIKWFHSQNS